MCGRLNCAAAASRGRQGREVAGDGQGRVLVGGAARVFGAVRLSSKRALDCRFMYSYGAELDGSEHSMPKATVFKDLRVAVLNTCRKYLCRRASDMGAAVTVNARDIFKAISKGLQADFEKSAAVTHSGGKGAIREGSLRNFLASYLPRRYAIGSGQIIQSGNRISRQCDIVIYDADHCPRLLADEQHSYFPIESVFGVVEVKSTLNSEELKAAFENIRSVKSLVQAGSFTLARTGLATRLARPIPVGVVFAYAADRSLHAVAQQAVSLSDATHPEYDPDFVAILGSGLVGPIRRLRHEWNEFKQPGGADRFMFRETSEHTVLGFYLRLLNELNAITLEPLDIAEYFSMPEFIGGHKVNYHHFLFKEMPGGKILKFKLNPQGVRKIVTACKAKGPIEFRRHLEGMGIKITEHADEHALKSIVYEYNPQKLPVGTAFCNPDNSINHLWIDEERYAIANGALEEEDLVSSNDGGLDELFER